VSAEPLRESAHRALIAAHLREANYGEAIAQYERCYILLRDELGVAPSPCLRDLIQTAGEWPSTTLVTRSAGHQFCTHDRQCGA
jgi:DNA-binding SARP family transcriptional activator